MPETFDGLVTIVDASRNTTVEIDGNGGDLRLGGSGQTGFLELRNPGGQRIITASGGNGDLGIGGNGLAGRLVINDATGNRTLDLNGGNADVRIGGDGAAGTLAVNDAANHRTIILNGGSGDIGLGGNGQSGSLVCNNAAGDSTVVVDGARGDVRIFGADCAEEFEIADDAVVDPGTVVIIGSDGRLRESTHPYDTAVAGIVAGGGASMTGIILGSGRSSGRVSPIALSGRVLCKVDASNTSIAVGDLLTTSSVPGHAMSVTDLSRAAGRVVGKALRPLAGGVGMIPVLVALQ